MIDAFGDGAVWMALRVVGKELYLEVESKTLDFMTCVTKPLHDYSRKVLI